MKDYREYDGLKIVVHFDTKKSVYKLELSLKGITFLSEESFNSRDDAMSFLKKNNLKEIIHGNAHIVTNHILDEYQRYDVEFTSAFLDFVAPDITVLDMIHIYQEIMLLINGDNVILVSNLKMDEESDNNRIRYSSIVNDVESVLYEGDEMVVYQYGDDTTIHQALINVANTFHSKGYDLIRVMDMELDVDGDIVDGQLLDLIW